MLLEFLPKKYIKTYKKYTENMSPMIVTKEINFRWELPNNYQLDHVIPSQKDLEDAVKQFDNGEITMKDLYDNKYIICGKTYKQSELIEKYDLKV
jgi:hypothetical protein